MLMKNLSHFVYILHSVSGLNYVLATAPNTGRPSIVSMSLGGGANSALDDAVTAVSILHLKDLNIAHLLIPFLAYQSRCSRCRGGRELQH